MLSTGNLTVSTTNSADDTLSLPSFQMSAVSHFYVEFDCQLMSLVVAGETLTNETDVSYASRPTGDHGSGVRDCESPPCNDDNPGALNNYGVSASHGLEIRAMISIVKTLPGGDDHFTIGENFEYNLRTWVIEGVSPDVEVHDDIPAGLTLQSHQITTPGMGIISFSNPSYDTAYGNVWFDLWNVTNANNNDPADDYFDVELTVRVDNIPANQDGVTITNGAYVSWSAGPDVPSGVVDIQITEPILEVSKTVFPTIQARGNPVTYTVIARHTTGTTDDGYDLVITDTLPAGLTFVSSTETNYGSGQNLEFRKPSLLQGDQWQFTYTVMVDANASSGTLENNLELDWASISGATGGQHSGRNGINCGQTDPLNNYCDLDETPLRAVQPAIEIQKTVYLGHDGGASCPGTRSLLVASEIEATFCFAATNTGNTYLNDITMVDDILGITEEDMTLLSGSLPLAPGDTLVYYYETTVAQSMENTVKTCGKSTDEYGAEVPNVDAPCADGTAEIIINPSIPTLSEWGMILFIFMLSITSIYYIRRQRTA